MGATMNVGCTINLRKLATKCRNCEYNPQVACAVIMKIRNPKATATIFQSGKVVVAGAKSFKAVKLASRKFARIIQKAGFKAKFQNFTVKNFIGCTEVGYQVRLEGIAKSFQKEISYEPELFPGLIYRFQEPKLSVVIFMSGKINFVNANSLQQMKNAFQILQPIIEKERKENY